MKTNYLKRIALAASIAGGLVLATVPAHAQSTEEVIGAVIGGTAGTVIGGEIDNRGSNVEGQVIGGLVGGTLGYVIGGELEKDKEIRRRYQDRPGEYYTYNGKPYRRYDSDAYDYVSFPIFDSDPYYYRDGRKKSHPVFAEHPGRGKGKGLRKNKHKYK